MSSDQTREQFEAEQVEIEINNALEEIRITTDDENNPEWYGDNTNEPDGEDEGE